MHLDNNVPEMSADFCERVVAASHDVSQRRPIKMRMIWDRVSAVMFPVRMNWVVATMALLFVVGVVMGTQSYTANDITDIAEIMEI